MSGVPWAAVQRLGQFAGLREEGDRIFKSEANEESDFSRLPAEVREALVVIGRLGPDAVEKSEQPVQQAVFPHTKADADRAKAKAEGGGTAVKESSKLQPGQGRQFATEILANMVQKLRKSKPNISEADAWVQVLDTPEGAGWYNSGEIAEQESRRK